MGQTGLGKWRRRGRRRCLAAFGICRALAEGFRFQTQDAGNRACCVIQRGHVYKALRIGLTRWRCWLHF